MTPQRRHLTGLLLAVAACDSATSPPDDNGRPVASVELTAAVAELSPGERFTFGAQPLGADGEPVGTATVEWRSSAPNVAIVDEDGHVIAIDDGTTEITAVSGEHEASATLTVVTSWLTISAGYDHACGITPDGSAWCWGSNAHGQLGTGTEGGSSPVPVPVTGGHSFMSISAGNRHTCARNAADELWCWGRNSFGELGSSPVGTVAVPTPALVEIAAAFTSYRAGNEHSCAVATGVGYCWGRDQHGQAGNGAETAATPTEVAGPAHWSLIDANGNGMTCGLDGTGAPWCWGAGYLGNASPDPADVPVAVDTDLRFDAFGTFYNGGCGLVEGAAYCWGENTRGTVGNASSTDAATPVAVTTTESFVHLAVGGAHACALTSDLRAFCWGDNERGEAGSPAGADCGAAECIRQPTAVTGGHEFLGLSAGDGLTCGVTAGGGGYCWGAGEAGQLGNGELERSSSPVRVRHPSSGQ